ncbi:hypothetical protein HYZ98_02750 [Candidatus Peregrinibacteria bacterium]|nr:hypothetical protein [Candidatus Peregrinibacteria bacterium]
MTQTTATHPIKRLAESRIECTVTFLPEEVSRAEASALERHRKNVTIKGFRPGHAPIEVVRTEVGSERLMDDTVRILLPQTLSRLIQEHQLKPIIPPTLSISTVSPLTIKLILVEHPTVTTKKIPPIEKKDVHVQDVDLQRIIDYTLKQYNQTELTDAFVKEKLGGTSVASFKDEVRKNLTAYEEDRENRRRQHVLLDTIRDTVEVDLAAELIAEEERILTQEFLEDLKRANVLVDDWCKQMKKTTQDLAKELRTQAEHRLKIRFGIEHLVENHKIVADDQHIEHAAKNVLEHLSEHDRKEQEPFYQKGQEGFERLRWKIQVEKLMEELLQ